MVNFSPNTFFDPDQKLQTPTPLHDLKPLLKFISNLKNENHPNLLNIDGDVVFLEEINTVAFRTDSPDHISTWK